MIFCISNISSNVFCAWLPASKTWIIKHPFEGCLIILAPKPSRRMVAVLICYLFHPLSGRAVEERRENMIKSRVTFLLKRTLSRYETSLGQMLPSQAPSRCSCVGVVSDSNAMCGGKSFHAEHNRAWGGKTWRERKGKVNAWNRWPTDQALPLHAPRGGINNKERPWTQGRGGEGGTERVSRAARGSARQATWGGFLHGAFRSGRHETAHQPGVRSAAVHQGRSMREPN